MDSLLRDEKRAKVGGVSHSSLNIKSVTPNSFDKMNVGPAKSVFSDKTINEIILHIAKMINCEQSILETCPSTSRGSLFMNSDRYRKRLTFLNNL